MHIRALTDTRGFSLLETIIAIGVLTFVMAAVFTLVSLGVRSVSEASNQLTAYFLASEGLEFIRNVRDGNVLSGQPAFDFLSVCETYGCVVDPLYGGGIGQILSCSGGCPRLYYESDPNSARFGTYNHDTESSTNVETIFTRQILLTTLPNGQEAKVRSLVTWRQFPGAPERQFTVETHLFDTSF